MRFFGKSVRTANMRIIGSALSVLGSLAACAAVGAQIGATNPPRSLARNTPSGRAGDLPEARAQTILEQTIFVLESQRSLAATIRHRADLFGRAPVGMGTYQEERRGPGLEGQLRFRHELRTQVGDQPCNLVEVCDGRHLWQYRELGDTRTLSRIDVGRVQRALEESGDITQLRKVDKWPGLGGLPRLLRGLHSSFRFELEGEGRLGADLPALKLRGEWNQQKLCELLPDQQEAIAAGARPDLSRLPDHVADHVLLYVGKADRLPYRIEYRRREAEQGRAGQGGARTLLSVEIEVRLNVPVDATRFAYQPPGDLQPSEQTLDFLKTLGLER
jgi:hypothetical protein